MARDEFDDFLDDDDRPTVDTRAAGRLLRVPLARIAPNKVNPRTDFGTKDGLIDFGKSLKRRQIQAVPVVTRTAYLKLWPDHAPEIGKVDVVIVSGERRFRAASAVDLLALECVIDDDVAESRKTFMEAVVSENVDRQNFDPVEEAYAVKALVTEFGTNRAVAQHFERADGWVTQRLALTYLAPEVQTMVRKRVIPLEHARKLGTLARDSEMSADQQVEWWTHKQKALIEAKEEAKEEKKRAKAAAKKAAHPKVTSQPSPPASEPTPKVEEPTEVPDPRTSPDSGGNLDPSFTAVKPDGPSSPEPVERATEPEEPKEEARQEDHHGHGPEEGGWHLRGRIESMRADWFPLQKPDQLARLLHERMSAEDFEQMVKVGQTLI